MRRIPVFALSLSMTASAWAGEAGWTQRTTITALEAHQDGRFVVRLNLEKSVSGCRSADGFYADYGRDGSDLMYHTALEALRDRLGVQVYATGGCDLNGLSAISSIRILP